MEMTQAQLDTMISDAVTKAAVGTVKQADFDTIIENRLSREREKYVDYGDLKKFKEDHRVAADQKNQEDLESQKKYDEAKKGLETKIGEMQGVITTKDSTIQNMQVTGALTGEVVNQNGFVEETIALLRANTIVDEHGKIFIKGKDANGIETNLSIADGVKDFLAKRPHLVKATGGGGGGTPPAGGAGGGGGGQSADLAELNIQLIQARNIGDVKRATEIKAKIRANLTGRGVNRNAV